MITHLTHNDLIDLHGILVNLRNDPTDPRMGDILAALVSAMQTEPAGDNHFRHALAALGLPADGAWGFVHHNNVYVYHVLIKDKALLTLLARAFIAMKTAHRAGASEKLSDMADALHNLPAAFCENGYRIPKTFYRNEMKWYRRKWGSTLGQ